MISSPNVFSKFSNKHIYLNIYSSRGRKSRKSVLCTYCTDIRAFLGKLSFAGKNVCYEGGNNDVCKASHKDVSDRLNLVNVSSLLLFP